MTPGAIVIDGGAHVGKSTAAALAMGASRVIAIEPESENLTALRRNHAQAIADGRVIVVDQGIHDHEGTLTFRARDHSASGQFGEESGAAGESLPVTTIDRLVARLQLPRVDFIKLDIEGSEVPALRGAAETLRRYGPRLTVGTYHRDGDLAGIEEIVHAIRPDYESIPAICYEYYSPSIYPQMLYFRPRTP
jgi:FkbM family methyltransferase